MERLSVFRQSLCSLHLPHGHMPSGRTQETDVDLENETVRVCHSHLSYLACLSISMYGRRGWALDFKEVCRAMNVVVLISPCGVRRAFVQVIILSLGTAMSFQNGHIRPPKIRAFGRTVEKLRIRMRTRNP